MKYRWKKYLLPVIFTILFSFFFIFLYLIVIRFSHFLRRELEKLINRYGRDNIVKIILGGNIKGLIDLFILIRKERIVSNK